MASSLVLETFTDETEVMLAIFAGESFLVGMEFDVVLNKGTLANDIGVT